MMSQSSVIKDSPAPKFNLLVEIEVHRSSWYLQYGKGAAGNLANTSTFVLL